ncbi:hypothetical protein J9A17_02065, partial [Bacteroides thetaiotaomicron]|nr:hypothetical protein [Bacteroides thetaiotaomicron]
NEFFFTHFLHSLFSGKDRDLKIQRQRVLYRGLTNKATYWYDKAAALGNKEAEKMLKVCKLHSGKN